jgi:hypothetical protein
MVGGLEIMCHTKTAGQDAYSLDSDAGCITPLYPQTNEETGNEIESNCPWECHHAAGLSG